MFNCINKAYALLTYVHGSLGIWVS